MSLRTLVLALTFVFSPIGEVQSQEFGPPFIFLDGFSAPGGLGVDVANGRLLVADTGHHRIKYAAIADLEGTPTWNEFGFVSGLAQPQALNAPQGVAIDAAGNAYAVDTFGNEAQLFRWDAVAGIYTNDPSFVQTTRNTVAGVDIAFPRDIAVGADGKVYLLDSGNRRILVADGPGDDSWEVWRENVAWGNPYGLDVADDGTVYLADTGNHRILRMRATGPEESIGSYGVGNGQFRYPRDVAVSGDGRIFVADTFNYRITILNSDGSHYLKLGSATLFGSPQKIEIDADNRVFVSDSGYSRLVAYLGAGNLDPFDGFIRDNTADTGAEPSGQGLLFSPDIVIRNNPDIDLQQAAESGLAAFAVQPPAPGISNHVYLELRNRGTHGAAGVTIRFYWVAVPVGSEDHSGFLPDWESDGFYNSYVSETLNDPGNSMFIPFVDSRHMSGDVEVDGTTVVGPLIWRLPQPAYKDVFTGRFFLLARLFHPGDSSDPIPTDANYIVEELKAESAFIVHDSQSGDSTDRSRKMESQLQELDVTVSANIAFFPGGILDEASVVTLVNAANPDVVYFSTEDADAESAFGKALELSGYNGIYFQDLDKFLAFSYLQEHVESNNNVAMWRSDIIVDPFLPTPIVPVAPDDGVVIE